MACLSFAAAHEPGECAACRRVVPLKKGYCRLCWMQASMEARGQVTVLEPFLREVRHQQLSFAGMQRWGARVTRAPGRQARPAEPPGPGSQPPEPRPVTGWVQLRLFDAMKDYTSSTGAATPTSLTPGWAGAGRRPGHRRGPSRLDPLGRRRG